jgi:Tol biopolymer transport system component
VLVICWVFNACDWSDPNDKLATTPSTPPYMGEALPTGTAVIFAPGTVSIEGRYEYALSIHPDGDRILFSAEVLDQGAAVFMSRAERGVWTTPEQVSLTAGARKYEMEAFFSPDGKSLFFAPYDEGMDVRIWTADLSSAGSENPRPVGPPVDQHPAFYPVQASDGFLYYTNLAQRAVYRAILGEDSMLHAEPAGLEFGGHAFPAPDGSYMLVDSASLDSDSDRDIFVAYRNDDGSWGSPQPLSSAVNTEHSETCPSLSPDGRFLFFSRYNEPGDISNIYWIDSQEIGELAPSRRGP